MMSEMKFVPVYSAEGKLAADMVRLMLESFGIHAVTEQESIGATYGIVIGPLGQVDVLVPENQVADAVEILASMDRGELETDTDSSGNDDTPNKDNYKLEE